MAEPPGAFIEADDPAIRDMKAEAERRAAAGQIAEETALLAERQRLVAIGCHKLATRVVSVSDQPGKGFDIQSFEADGSERCIEVKSVGRGNHFFLSIGEWMNSRGRPNYWFYLVNGREVAALPAGEVRDGHLKPTQFEVRFERGVAEP